jgi:hypothetical protein
VLRALAVALVLWVVVHGLAAPVADSQVHPLGMIGVFCIALGAEKATLLHGALVRAQSLPQVGDSRVAKVAAV